MVLELAGFLGGGGDTVDWLISIPVPSFVSAFRSYARIDSRQARARVIGTFVSAQGTKESMEAYAAALGAAAAPSKAAAPKPRNDSARFISMYGTNVGNTVKRKV